MAKIGARVTDAEARIAARYFAGLRPRPWIRVVESGEVPHMRVAGWMMVPDGSTREPIGERIIEMPVDPERTELRDDASGFVAWVPPGSLRRGAQLAQTGGGGTTIPCASCHGPGLKGQGDVPPLAGRSPSYVVRQLYDIRHGQRSGPTVAPMQPVVAQLGLRDMVALAAYTASLPP
jgi:cytochrome c553